MTIEICKDKRIEVIASIQRYFEKNMEDKIGNMTAGAEVARSALASY